MQKAVEKRKATLAAKKAAQVAAERNGVLASRADTGPSQTVQAPALPVENTPFAHGYHSAVLQHAEQPHMPQQMPRQQQQQQQLPPPPPPPQPHPLGFGAGYPYQH